MSKQLGINSAVFVARRYKRSTLRMDVSDADLGCGAKIASTCPEVKCKTCAKKARGNRYSKRPQ